MLNYQFESMEPIKVKGKEKPIKLYFPTADKVEEEIQASLNSSGRHAEVAECRGTIAELCTYRNGGTMAITGGYGSGRTEVVKSLEKTAKEANMKFIGTDSVTFDVASGAVLRRICPCASPSIARSATGSRAGSIVPAVNI